MSVMKILKVVTKQRVTRSMPEARETVGPPLILRRRAGRLIKQLLFNKSLL